MFLFGNKKEKKEEDQPEDLIALKQDIIENEVENYKNENGFSIKNLEYGLWYQEHKKDFLLVWIWFLVITAVVFWSYSLYYFTSYLFDSFKKPNVVDVVVPHIVKDYSENISSEFVKALPLGNGRYNLVAKITNNLAGNWFTLNYNFKAGDEILEQGNSYVYPGETKYIVSFDKTYIGSPDYINFGVDFSKTQKKNMYYNELRSLGVNNWYEYQVSHYYFQINDKIFQPASETGLSDKTAINRLSFSVTNSTAYDFKQANFLVLLYNGNDLIAVDRYAVSNFESRNIYKANINFYGAYPPVDKIEVVPDFDVLDKNNYSRIK